MKTINDVHQQFAEYFPSKNSKPYLYLLSLKLSEGHICIDINDLENEKIPDGYVLNPALLKKDPLVSVGGAITPMILHQNLLYLQRYYTYETLILKRIEEFIEQEEKYFLNNVKALVENKKFIQKLFDIDISSRDKNEDKINWQLVAAITATMNHFTIITGGPGTGKTTTVAKILSILFTMNAGLKVALAAPTGKAATRMGESLLNTSAGADEEMKSLFESMEPLTIHRLLGWKKNSIYFKHNANNPLNYDVVIVDEASMIDVALFAKLLDAIGKNTRLILLGDKDQLASVEAGSLFGDLCQGAGKLNAFGKEKAGIINQFINDTEARLGFEISTTSSPLAEHIIELKKSHRFSDTKGIGRFSKAIIKNDLNILKDFFENKDDQVEIDAQYQDNKFNEFIAGYEAYIKEKDIALALKKMNQLKVLCAVREAEQGLYAINKKIEQYLLQRGFIKITGEFYENRPVMITGNNYELSLFNGDTGIVRYNENGELRIWFEDKEGVKSVFPSFISNSETMYAITIHKSQGSEFEKVLVVLPSRDNVRILTRELLYTAVTRAKNKVLIQGSEEIILQTATNFVKRGSGIIQRLTQ